MSALPIANVAGVLGTDAPISLLEGEMAGRPEGGEYDVPPS
jgi:hypothetical protein